MTDPEHPLLTPVQFVRGVGPKRAELLAKLGVFTVRDLLYLVPREVLDLTQVLPVDALREDQLQTVRGTVVDRDSRVLSGNRTMTAILLKCTGGFVRGSWFNQPYMLRKFEPGQAVLFSGKPKFRERRWEFSHPRVQWLGDDEQDAHGGLVPRYSLTDGLNMEELRRGIRAAVEDFAPLVEDVYPPAFREELDLEPLGSALTKLHLPETLDDYERARRRLLYDDLLEFQLGIALRRRSWQRGSRGIAVPISAKVDARIRGRFPFVLTPGQEAAIREISQDLARELPMHRLLQADVGAGKTAVAVYAMLAVIAGGAQVALMAPTEILAQQHWQVIDNWLAGSRVERRLLTGQQPAARRRQTLEDLAEGRVQLVVGTQALIQADVRFAKLGLLVIDEQHKFGVLQRSRYSQETLRPHVLVMTATPIPRSLCLTQFGDLDLSTIHDLPPGRQKVLTSRVHGPKALHRAWEFIRQRLQEGRQLYVVCPRIDDGAARDAASDPATNDNVANDNVSARNAIREASKNAGEEPSPAPMLPAGRGVADVAIELERGPLSGFRLGVVHGQMDRAERSAIMDQFRSGHLHVLVSTTVIEVGVDVPNATLMVILEAERFGLSQLHQLRGRIGRGRYQGYCFLVSESDQPEAVRRLAALESHADGFRIAEIDFELRGPGDVLGTRQHGDLPLRLADLTRDQELLLEARLAAFDLVGCGRLDEPEFAPLKIRVLERFHQLMDLPTSG